MLKPLMVITITLLTAGCFTFAQAEEEKMQSEGRGFFTIGWQNVELSDLNTALAGKGYGEIADRLYSMGGCGYGVVKDRLILGGEGQALLSDPNEAQGYDVSLTGAYGMFNIGYIVMKKGEFNLYPLVGFGGGAVSLKIVKQGSVTFDEILTAPERGMEIHSGGILLSVGFGADYLVNLSENPDETGGIAFGIRLGYHYTPFAGDWFFEDSKISGGPDTGITGPFIKLMIGGGGKNNK